MKRAALLALIACGSPASAPPPAPVAHHTSVHADHRLELVAVVGRLAGHRAFVQGIARPYLDDVDKQFARYFDDPAVVAAKQIKDDPLALAVCLDDNLVPRCDMEHWHALEDFRAKLRAFADASGFEAFFTAHAAYYKQVSDRIAQQIDADKPAESLASVFGKLQDATVTVVPGLVEGPTTTIVRAQPLDKLEITIVLGVDQLDSKGMPVVHAHEAVMRAMVRAYVDPLIARHEGELASAGQRLYALTGKAMRRHGLATWQAALGEALARAAIVAFARDKAAATRAQLHDGFAWTPELADAIARYGKLGHADVEAFEPTLDGTLANLATHPPQPPFYGPIDAALDADPQATVYGTPADKPIAELLARTQWIVDGEHVALGSRTFTGKGLVLVAVSPRQDDPTRGVVAHVAARASDLAGIDDVRHGGNDWLIARHRPDGGFDVVAEGDF